MLEAPQEQVWTQRGVTNASFPNQAKSAERSLTLIRAYSSLSDGPFPTTSEGGEKEANKLGIKVSV